MAIEFEFSLWSITVSTNLLQIYLLWLVLRKSSANMLAFRFALCSLLGNELIFSVVVGYIMDPELLFPYVRGAAVKGLARFLGKNGGRFAFTLALFFGAGVLWNQIYCLIFRYTAIQQHFEGLNAKFNRLKIRCLFMVLGYSISTVCGFIAFHSMVAPENVYMEFRRFPPLLTWVNNDTVIMLLGTNEDLAMLAFGIFVFGGFTFATTLSIAFSVIIYHTIHKNVNCFTARTYKLHRQLTMLLTVQFCLPIFFLVIPVCYAAASVIFLFPIGKLIGDLTVLLLSLYTMANALSTLIFITPYRDYTLKLLRIRRKSEEPRSQQIQSLRTTRIEGIPRSME